MLVEKQHSEPKSSASFQVVDEQVCHYTQNVVLMRQLRLSGTPTDDEWTISYQIVVLKYYWSELLGFAHDTPFWGHLGVNNPYHKILNHFLPKLKCDIFVDHVTHVRLVYAFKTPTDPCHI